MQDIFLGVLDRSISTGIVILAVLLVRLFLRKAPKVFSYALWAVVLFRLLVPFSIEGSVSLIPREAKYIPQEHAMEEYGQVAPIQAASAAARAVGDVLNGGVGRIRVRLESGGTDSQGNIWYDYADARHSQVWLLFFGYVWPVGMGVMLICCVLSFFRLRRRLVGAVPLERSVWLADHVASPFVIGVFRPRIYLPSSLAEGEREYIILHERYHIRRLDHVVRLLASAALCIHWFNPLVWTAFVLSGRDMEMSCDEAVLARLGECIRGEYAASLLESAAGRRMFPGMPPAFGGDVKGRIRNLMRWKKPKVWLSVSLSVLLAVVCVFLLLDPAAGQAVPLGADYSVAEVVYRPDMGNGTELTVLPEFSIGADYSLYGRAGGSGWIYVGQLEKYPLTGEELGDYLKNEEGWQGGYRLQVGGGITEAYRLRKEEGAFYLVFQTKKGDTMLGYGWSETDGMLSVLFRLENQFSGYSTDANYLERSLCHEVGAYVSGFSYYEVERGYVIMGFLSGAEVEPSQMTDMGFAVFRIADREDSRAWHLVDWQVVKDAVRENNGICCCPYPAVANDKGTMTDKNTYDVILSCNEELARITRVYHGWDGEDRTVTKQIGGGTGAKCTMTLFSWEEETDAESVSQYFYDRQGNEMMVD